MSVNYTVQLTTGDSTANYNIYYDAITPLNYAILISNSLNATGITYNDLFSGVGVTIPDTSTNIIIKNNGACDNSVIIPISPTLPITPPELCMTFTKETINYLWLFTPNGTLNGRPTWEYIEPSTSNTYNIIWNPVIPANPGGPNGRWEMAFGNTYIFTTTNTTNTPDSGWYPIALYVNAVTNLQVTQGSCPLIPNLTALVNPTNTTCYNTTPCDGTAVVVPSGGLPPYTYSIDGINFQTSNIIQNLCEGRYSIITKDSTNARTINRFAIGHDNVPITYTITVQVNNSINITNTQQQKTTQTYWEIVCDNPIPVGTTINLSLRINTNQKLYGPGYGTILYTNQVYKNNTQLTQALSASTNSTSPRPLCSLETISSTANTETYNFTLTNGDVVSGISISDLTITNLVTLPTSSCSTNLEQGFSFTPALSVQNPISGCKCCNVVIGKLVQNSIISTLG